MMYFQSLFAFLGCYLMLLLPMIMLAMGIFIASYLILYKIFSYQLFSMKKNRKLVVLLVIYSLIYLTGCLVQWRDMSLVNIDIIQAQQGFVMLSMLFMAPYLCHIILKYLDNKNSRFKHQLKS